MLSHREKQGLSKILGALDDSDIGSLVQTVSCGQLRVTDRKEGEKAILSCTVSSADLLRRKKILREIIFRYLLSEEVFVDPSLPKADLIRACLEHWESECDTDEKDETVRVPEAAEDATSNGTEKSMGVKFTEWFFSQLNGQTERLGPQHFFGTCQMMMECLESSQGPPQVVELQGPLRVSCFLWEMAGGSRRLFHPNGETVRCYFEAHGLAKIKASGVIHEMGNCVGLFDLLFGLIKDPSVQDNWKIQYVHAELRVSVPLVTTCIRILQAVENGGNGMELECY